MSTERNSLASAGLSHRPTNRKIKAAHTALGLAIIPIQTLFATRRLQQWRCASRGVARRRLGNPVGTVETDDLRFMGHIALAVGAIGGDEALVRCAREPFAYCCAIDRRPCGAQLCNHLAEHADRIVLRGGEG